LRGRHIARRSSHRSSGLSSRCPTYGGTAQLGRFHARRRRAANHNMIRDHPDDTDAAAEDQHARDGDPLNDGERHQGFAKVDFCAA
jgi:hypothetical protein